MKRLSPLLFVLLLIAGCHSRQARIEGTLDNAGGMLVELAPIDSAMNTVSDSARADDAGHFRLRTDRSLPGFHMIRVNGQVITLALYPGDQVKISADARQAVKTLNIEGSEDSRRIQSLQKSLLWASSARDSLNNILNMFSNPSDLGTVRRQMEYTYLKVIDSLRRSFIRSVTTHPDALSSLFALYQQLPGGNFVFSQESDIQYFALVDSALFARYPTLYHVKTLHANVREMKAQLRTRQVERLIAGLGTQAKDIRLPDPSGKMIALSSLRGKYVLLDFWAAWCAPCRAENPNLVANYEQYKDKNFEIFQVSLDQTRQAWTRAIREDGLNWIHVSDLKFWESEAVSLYQLEAIPANFLIDPEGIIIAKDLRGPALGKKLAEVLGETPKE
jgi:peroxiredoxin